MIFSRLAIVGSIILACGIFVFLVYQGATEDLARSRSVAAQLTEIKRLESVINQDVLRSKSGFNVSYDTIVSAMQRSNAFIAHLETGPHSILNRGDKAVDRLFTVFKKGHEQKYILVERFKRDNSVLRNSLYYFPKFAKQLIQDLREVNRTRVLADALEKLALNTLMFTILGNADMKVTVRRNIEEIRKMAATGQGGAVEKLKLLTRHAEIIVAKSESVKSLVGKITSPSRARFVEELIHAHEVVRGARQQNSKTFSRAFYVFALSLLLAVGYTLTRLLLTRRKLAAVNQSLELKVEERTAALSLAMDKAELANRTKSEFLAGMSHELRTPLNAIIGFSEIIDKESLGPVGNPQYREYASHIHASGQHLLELINDVLDISKIEADAVELQEEDINLAGTIRSCVTMIKERAQKSGIVLITDNIDDTVPLLRADPRRLKQIFINLMSNAVKFTEAGGTVTITSWYNSDNGYAIQVKDTGIGIAADDIPKALARFQQIDGRLSREFEGTGLGLPLTKALVELHGGSLDLQSEIGNGTIVTVRLPAERCVHRENVAHIG